VPRPGRCLWTRCARLCCPLSHAKPALRKTDRLNDTAWSSVPWRYRRLAAGASESVINVHSQSIHVSAVTDARSTKTALDAHQVRLSRLFATSPILAICFLPCLNYSGPRYCTGYVGYTGVPPPVRSLIDFSAWFRGLPRWLWLHLRSPLQTRPDRPVLIARADAVPMCFFLRPSASTS